MGCKCLVGLPVIKIIIVKRILFLVINVVFVFFFFLHIAPSFYGLFILQWWGQFWSFFSQIPSCLSFRDLFIFQRGFQTLIAKVSLQATWVCEKFYPSSTDLQLLSAVYFVCKYLMLCCNPRESMNGGVITPQAFTVRVFKLLCAELA